MITCDICKTEYHTCSDCGVQVCLCNNAGCAYCAGRLCRNCAVLGLRSSSGYGTDTSPYHKACWEKIVARINTESDQEARLMSEESKWNYFQKVDKNFPPRNGPYKPK